MVLDNNDAIRCLLPFYDLKQDPEVSKETINTLQDLVNHFVEQMSDVNKGLDVPYFDWISTAYSCNGWKNELSDLADACKISLDFFMDESTFPHRSSDYASITKFRMDKKVYLNNPNQLLFLTLERSDLDIPTFNSLKKYFEQYKDTTIFSWLSGYIRKSIFSSTNNETSRLNERLINLFDFYSLDLVKGVVDSSFRNSSKGSDKFFQDMNQLLLRLENDYPTKMFEVLSKMNKFTYPSIPRSWSIITREDSYFDTIFKYTDTLIKEGMYDDVILYYNKLVRRNQVTSKSSAEHFFELVIKNSSMLQDERLNNYFSIYNEITDLDFRGNFSDKEFEPVFEAYNLCLYHLNMGSSDLSNSMNHFTEFSHLFFSNFNEAICSGDTISEKKSNLREWSLTVTRMIKNDPKLLFEYLTDQSYAIGGKR